MNTDSTSLLRLRNLNSGYGRVKILNDVSLSLRVGSCVTVVGSNGAGKSTLLRSISGMVDIHSGSIVFDGQDITKLKPVEVVRRGIRHVAEGRRLFRQLSVSENLELGMYGVKLSNLERTARRERAFDLFPVLRRKKGVLAGTMSGGEQQMLAIAQALMSEPRLLMLDEPSLGLAPVIIDEVFDTLVTLHKAGVTVLLVEQMVERALDIADYAYVMQVGRIVAEGKGRDLIGSEAVRQAYLGTKAMDRAPPDKFVPLVEAAAVTSSNMSPTE